MSDIKNKVLLEQLRRILPESNEWEEWLENTGELPPDFDSLPSHPEPPNPLIRYENGKEIPVKTLDEWARYREEIKSIFYRWVLGNVPPPPDNFQVHILEEKSEGDLIVRKLELRFGPKYQASLWLELLIPPGSGPFPVFMTQHNHRGWALIALRRGYLSCIYAGSDSRDDTESFIKAYPGYDWSRLTRRAWAASRCIDYLSTLPYADTDHIALTGHSRNGKQSLIAAILDERINVVISSSSGAGGAMTTRDFSEQHFGEGIELLTRVFPDWFHPRLRFFAGREHKLPVDFNELIALIAPRPCLLSIALNDPVESAWAMEETYLSAKKVYKLLGVEENLRILWRQGSHETWTTIIERYLDWCDLHFGRGSFDFPERLIYPHDWERWRVKNKVQIDAQAFPRNNPDDILILEDNSVISSVKDWEHKKKEVQKRVKWMLGEEPPQTSNPGDSYGLEPGHIATLLGRNSVGEGVRKEQIAFGEYINGDIYTPQDSGPKVPAILWLHPFSFSHGYMPAYRRGEHRIFLPFVQAGFAVFCFDQIGFGRRIEEVENFYERHPRWSLLGKMLRDSQAALDILTSLPYVDPDRIILAGYGLGALAGIHLGALDERLKGLAIICPPEPFRSDTPDKGTGGIRRWSHRHMLLPRLGFFAGEEERIPYDIHLLLGCLAPRPVLVVSPQLDREANIEDITSSISQARLVYHLYDASLRLQQISPETYNQFGPEIQDLVIGWLKGLHN